MLPRRSAEVLCLAFLMLSGLAVADESNLFRMSEQGLAATNYDLSLSTSSPLGFESALPHRRFFPGSFSPPGTWTLSIVAQGMESYVLTAVVTGTGGLGFTGVSRQSTTATQEGYFGAPIMLASNSEPTSYVAEPSTANLMFTGIFFVVGMARRRVLVR